MKEKIEELIKKKTFLANNYKQAMEMAKDRNKKANRYDFNEFLNTETSISFNKAYYMALVNQISDLENLLKEVDSNE